ncbi:MAG: PEP-CTERM sorting domain-containing protein [Rhodospirillaceae bacterium]|nr:PEP-CTERM sorting domain-containing protein [Rhodospirillaceae bacterium]
MKKLLGLTAAALVAFTASQASAVVIVRWDMNATDGLAVPAGSPGADYGDFGYTAIFGKSSCMAGHLCEPPFPGINPQTGRPGEIEAFNGAELMFQGVQTDSLLGIFSGFDAPAIMHNHNTLFPDPTLFVMDLHVQGGSWGTVWSTLLAGGERRCVGWGLSNPSDSNACTPGGSDIANWTGVTSTALDTLWDNTSGPLGSGKPGSISLGGTFIIDGLRLYALDPTTMTPLTSQDAFHLGTYFVDFAFSGDIVPAPGALFLLGAGLLGVGALRRRVK